MSADGPTDDDVAALCDAGDYNAAATLALRRYGAGIMGFQRALTRSDDVADEAFAIFCENLWRGLPGFVWPGMFRAWLYRVARNACHRVRRDPFVRRRRFTPEVAAFAAHLKSTTAIYKRPETSAALQQFRDGLSEEDQALLTLRLDRGMSWREAACVLEDDADPDRTAARLRKRFQRLKDELRAFMDGQRDALERDAIGGPRTRSPAEVDGE